MLLYFFDHSLGHVLSRIFNVHRGIEGESVHLGQFSLTCCFSYATSVPEVNLNILLWSFGNRVGLVLSPYTNHCRLLLVVPCILSFPSAQEKQASLARFCMGGSTDTCLLLRIISFSLVLLLSLCLPYFHIIL